ncbi:hypothetical protein CEXT_378231 [Caerostris extrusa]|uniref:Uncharacterized protein n=1 Tax=Caerostris extrusa TaxID=172846 RepID=A0AAV4RVQ2_CAEEX|nr:hypothetical protein CEXT_378231 [Caerostris extrusa]
MNSFYESFTELLESSTELVSIQTSEYTFIADVLEFLDCNMWKIIDIVRDTGSPVFFLYDSEKNGDFGAKYGNHATS